jgi:prepilin peptidase CpaA
MTLDQPTIWNAVVVSFALTAAAGDARWRKIPKSLTTAAMLAGLSFHAFKAIHGLTMGGSIRGGIFEFGYSAAACLIGFAIGLTFFQLGAIGGGDVKLIMALGAMLGLPRWLFAMEVAIFAAAAIALIQALRRGLLKQTLANIVDTFRWVLTKGVRQHPVINVSNAAMLRAPFGIAAAVGTLAAVIKL